MPNPDRPKVGPADPETRRKMLRQKLDEPTRGEGVSARAEPKKPKSKKKGATLSDLLDASKPRERRVSGEDETISDAVNRGVAMGSEKKRK